MKKILMAIVLCLVCTFSFGQYRIVDTVHYKLNDDTFQASSINSSSKILLPKVIYDEYKLGRNLTTAGIICTSIAVPVLIAGIGCFGDYKPQFGAICFGLSSTLIATSIPLYCWGDHLKRNASKDFELLQFKNNIMSTNYLNH